MRERGKAGGNEREGDKETAARAGREGVDLFKLENKNVVIHYLQVNPSVLLRDKSVQDFHQ